MKKRYLILILAILLILIGLLIWNHAEQEANEGQKPTLKQAVRYPSYSLLNGMYNLNEKQNIPELTSAANKELNTTKKDGKLHVFHNDNTYLVQYNSDKKIALDGFNTTLDSVGYKTEKFLTGAVGTNDSFYEVISLNKGTSPIKFQCEVDGEAIEVVTKDVNYQIADEKEYIFEPTVEQALRCPSYSFLNGLYNSNEKQNIPELTSAANKELNTTKKDGKVHVFYNNNTYLVQYNSDEKIALNTLGYIDNTGYKNEKFETGNSATNDSFYEVISLNEGTSKIKFKSELDNTPLKVVTKDVDYQITADE